MPWGADPDTAAKLSSKCKGVLGEVRKKEAGGETVWLCCMGRG